jgi:hypothetical protein
VVIVPRKTIARGQAASGTSVEDDLLVRRLRRRAQKEDLVGSVFFLVLRTPVTRFSVDRKKVVWREDVHGMKLRVLVFFLLVLGCI